MQGGAAHGRHSHWIDACATLGRDSDSAAVSARPDLEQQPFSHLGSRGRLVRIARAKHDHCERDQDEQGLATVFSQCFGDLAIHRKFGLGVSSRAITAGRV